MGRYTEASCKLCRRAKEKLFLKGDRCASAKCPVLKRPYPPGQHGNAPQRISEYGIRLREKQKAKQIYGLSERQFSKYFSLARSRKGITGDYLLQLLERRLDNAVHRLGFGASRQSARQMVRHGHVLINGRKMNVPSYQVRIGDIISLKEASKEKVKIALEADPERRPPEWLSLDEGKLEGKVSRLPEREEIDTLVSVQLIVEFYSR